MGFGQTFGDLEGYIQSFIGRKSAFGDFGRESPSLNIRHGDVSKASGFFSFVNGADMRMVKGRRGMGFPQESFFCLRPDGKFARQKFQGDRPSEMGVLRFEDDPHPSPAQLAFDLVFARKQTSLGQDFLF